MYCRVLFILDEAHGDDMIRDSDKGYANWFGNASATFHPGDILVAPAQFREAANQHNPGIDFFFPGVNFPSDFPAVSVVSVKIIHTPSGQIIFDKDVVVA